MSRVDARMLKPEAREALRVTAVRMHQQKYTQEAIAKALGVRRATVSDWLKAYRQRGEAGLKQKPLGRAVGTGRHLSAAQEGELQQTLIEYTPDELGLAVALWSAAAVRVLIHRTWGWWMPLRTVRRYLQRWGWTPQRPLRRAYERDPAAVAQWLETDYPKLVARAQAEGATIYWGDETAVSSIEHYPRGYAPKGHTPVLILSQGQRHRLNLISAISRQGKVRFMTYRERLTAQVLIRFLARLMGEAERKVFLVLDNLRVHHSRQVRAWLAQHTEHIELFFLPCYAPDLNPDEYLNCDLKARLHAGEPVRNTKQLTRKVLSHLHALQKSPQRVQAYFDNENIQYAA